MKKILVLSISMLLLFSLAATVLAEEKGLSVFINEDEIYFEGDKPFIEEGTTLVPVAPLFEKLNLILEWNSETKTVTGTKDGLVISIQIGNQTATVNGQSKELIITPRIIEGSSYVPLRYVSEAAGYEVLWDGATQTIKIVEAEAEVEVEVSRGFMWKAQKGDNIVYLLGSIHVANGEMYPLHSSIEEAFTASDYLVVEADVTKSDPQEMQQIVMDKGTYQDGSTLKDHISPESYSQLNDIMVEHGMSAEALGMFKPWVTMSTVQYLQMAKAGYESELGIDLYFIMNAMESNKPVLELESVEFQLDMLNELSPELQELLLQETLDEYYSIENTIHEMAKMWKTGDDETLLLITEKTAEHEELNKAMIDDRNIAMTETVEAYLNAENPTSYFVVVGAAHMLGETGIITLLLEAGYNVTRQ